MTAPASYGSGRCSKQVNINTQCLAHAMCCAGENKGTDLIRGLERSLWHRIGPKESLGQWAGAGVDRREENPVYRWLQNPTRESRRLDLGKGRGINMRDLDGDSVYIQLLSTGLELNAHVEPLHTALTESGKVVRGDSLRWSRDGKEEKAPAAGRAGEKRHSRQKEQ